MKTLLMILSLMMSANVMAAPQTLVCYDELGRKSTILKFDLTGDRAVIEESGDEFVCAPGMDVYCTTSAGEVEATPSLLRFSWVRELTGELAVYEVNTADLTYIGDYAGAMWQGQCEQAAID